MSRTSLAFASAIMIAATALGPALAGASVDLVALTRARFPDRAWAPITAADAALAGAGRAVDPASGWSANPALLARVKGNWARGTGLLLDPRRNDVQTGTYRYSDESPHFTFGEAGLVEGSASHSWGVYVTQDSYDKARESFIDTAAGQAPTAYANEFRSSLARAGLAGALSFGRASVGLAFEAYRPEERFESLPPIGADPSVLGAQGGRVRLHGLCLGGAAGLLVQLREGVAVGASARAAASGDLEDEDGHKVGSDEAPLAANLGVQVGRGAGGNLLLGAGYTGPRDVALGDSIGRGDERAEKRLRLAAGYSYQPAAMPWEFRAGLGWSPYPGGGEARYSSLGVGLGFRMQASMARVSYTRESRRAPNGDRAARTFATLGLDIHF
jgi:hypothetical protein